MSDFKRAAQVWKQDPNHLRDDQVAQASPHCPTCGALLIFRPSYRRFIESNRYVECPDGHLWNLVPVQGDER